ncbi:uncharacterized protein K02A2.6-like [Dermacentor silvarum]|uniref:uncharacterized protein K02A2.6-like n=1 Tax=Dermacentor silvarum TaxID=543639 RepID=UPI0021010C7B|nr:uncharacterized protein K02A2.6-like [Dermacentor silvarum]
MASLTIVRVCRQSLCDHDLSQALNNEGAAVFSMSSVKEQEQNLQAILCEKEDVFLPELGRFKFPPAHLYMKEDAVPKFFKARSLPYTMREKVSNEHDRLGESETLSPVAHSEWATPIVPVMKKGGTVRLCGDYKLTVNISCVTEQYLLPVINYLFVALHESDVYSTSDLRDAYNQVPLDEQLKKRTVVNTHRGLF